MKFTTTTKLALLSEVLNALFLIFLSCVIPLCAYPITLMAIVTYGPVLSTIGILMTGSMLLTIYVPAMAGFLFLAWRAFCWLHWLYNCGYQRNKFLYTIYNWIDYIAVCPFPFRDRFIAYAA